MNACSFSDRANVTGAQLRAAWVQMLVRVSEPVLAAMANNRLKVTMPVEVRTDKLESPSRRDRCTAAVGDPPI